MKVIGDMNWLKIYEDLNAQGYSKIPGVLSSEECLHLQGFYGDGNLFRSTINMERYRFGKGEYKYFKYPLPLMIEQLRNDLYPRLAKIANEWMKKLNMDVSFPDTHQSFIEQCASKNQLRPTPLILRYEKDGHNTLHQDLYGDIYFPFQVLFVLTEVDKDHQGGEVVFVEQLPRAQSKAEVLVPNQGDAIIFTTNFRPVQGSKGFYRSKMKHGISKVTSGVRYALGIIFHDAT